MLAFTYSQRGEIPVDPVKRAIVDAHQRGVILFLNEITINLSGRVVKPGTQPHPRRLTLLQSLEAKTIQTQEGVTTSVIGFKGKPRGSAFVARIFERGAAAPTPSAVVRPFRYKQNRHHPGRERGAGLSRFVQGRAGEVVKSRAHGSFISLKFAGIFRRKTVHKALMPRPILGLAYQIAAPVVVQDYKESLDRALHE